MAHLPGWSTFLALLSLGNLLHAQDRPLPWTFNPVFTIGGVEDTAVVLSTLYPDNLAVVPGNRLALVDRVERQLIIIGPDGRVEYRLGRQGAGPGEINYPGALASAPDGSIWVWDGPRQGLVGFTKSGDPETRPTAVPGHGVMSNFHFLADGAPVALRSLSDTLSLWGTTGVLASLVQPLGYHVQAPQCEITTFRARPVFTPRFLWDSYGRSVAYNTDGSFSIHIRGGTFNGTTLTRDKARRKASSAMAMKSLGRGAAIIRSDRTMPCYVLPDDILAAAGYAHMLPAYSRIFFTSEDSLWAVRFTLPEEPKSADIYSLSKGYVGTVLLGSVSPIAARDDGTIVSLESDADDVPRIVAYQVEH